MRPAPALSAAALALLIAAPAAAHPPADAKRELSDALACYAAREQHELEPAVCADIVFHLATGRVVAYDLKQNHLTLRHADLAGINPAGVHDYHVEPGHLLAALEVGDQVVFVVESRHGHIVDVYPLIK